MAEVCAGCATAWMSCIHKKAIYKLYKWKAMLIFRQRLNRSSIARFTYFGPTTHLDFARLKRLNYLSPLLPV